jgi:ferric-dicitrate binding protein FerR (iron transport regulator)
VKKNHNPDMDRLLVKCLLNEATAAERGQVDEWCAAGAGNREYFEDFRLIWEESRRLAPAAVPDETGAWERFRRGGRFPVAKPEWDGVSPDVKPERGLASPGAKRGKGLVVPFRVRKSYAAAAVLILLAAGAGGWWVFSGRWPARSGDALLSLQTQSLPRTDTLPDGTVITLNQHSALQFPREFRGEDRTVELEGEGFFQVVHRGKQPFVVRMNGVTIRDLGTSFNVRSGREGTEVIVASGEVEVESGSGTVKAGAGERVFVPVGRSGPRKAPYADELYRYYQTKQFVCRNTPLWRLTEVLNEAYHADIVIEGKDARDLPLTATFRHEALDSLLPVIARTFGLTINRNGHTIILKK